MTSFIAIRFGGRKMGLFAVVLIYIGFLSVVEGFPNLYVQVCIRGLKSYHENEVKNINSDFRVLIKYHSP